MLYQKGILTFHHVYYDLIGVPAAGTGIALGVAVYNRFDQVVFGRVVTAGLLVTGLAYIASSTVDLLADKDLARHPQMSTRLP